VVWATATVVKQWRRFDRTLMAGIIAGTFLQAGGFADLPDLPFVSGATSANLDSGTDILTIRRRLATPFRRS